MQPLRRSSTCSPAATSASGWSASRSACRDRQRASEAGRCRRAASGDAAAMPETVSTRAREAIDAALAEETLCGAFQVTVRAGGNRPALRTYGADDVVTWEQYGRRVRAVAAGLHGLGVRSGGTVALLLRNRPDLNIADTASP